MQNDTLQKDEVAFLGVATAFCSTLEQASQLEKNEFVAAMLKLLPRIYIAISGMPAQAILTPTEELPTYLEAGGYEQIREGVASVMGEDDVFLETFEEDMKYSDTPIASSVSESLADIYQSLFNCAVGVRESGGDMLAEYVQLAREEFAQFWGQTLCNVMRPLHNCFYNS